MNYPAKTQAVDNLTNSFRPVFTDAGIKQSQKDIASLDQFATQFQTRAIPSLAKQLSVTPDQLVAALSDRYPDVGKGVQELPTSLPYFTRLVEDLAAQQRNFHQADAIPTKNLPATTIHWLFVILGILAIAMAAVGLLLRPKSSTVTLAGSAVGGLALIAVSLILSVPSKAKAVDAMTDAFRPVFTAQSATQTRAYLTTVQNMDQQLMDGALPGLAAMLKVSPEQLSASLKQNFPAVATGLQQMPQILSRFDGLVANIERNVKNFQLADSIPSQGTHTTMLEDQLAVPAGVLVLAGLTGLGVPMATARVRARRPPPVASAGSVR